MLTNRMNRRSYLVLAGPLLFAVAQMVLPGGSAQPAERLAIIVAEPGAWEAGHLLIALALILLAVAMFRWHQIASLMHRILAGAGLALMLWALFADYSIAVLQLASQALLGTLPRRETVDVLHALAHSTPVNLIAYLPYLGWVPGVIGLAVPLLRTGNFRPASWTLITAGVLIVAAGIMGSKPMFIVGSLVQVAAFVLFLRARPDA